MLSKARAHFYQNRLSCFSAKAFANAPPPDTALPSDFLSEEGI